MNFIKSISSIFLVLFCTNLSAQNSINFEKGTWAEIKQKAKKEKKFIFLDCYTSWCKPCKVMEKEVFTNDSVATFYNQNFICIKLDMESNIGTLLNRQFEVVAYPTFLFIDVNDSIHYRAEGYQKPQEFIQIGKKVIEPQPKQVLPVKQFQPFLSDLTQIKSIAAKNFLSAYPSLLLNLDRLSETDLKEIISSNYNFYDYPKETTMLLEQYYMNYPIEHLFLHPTISFISKNLSKSNSYLLACYTKNPKLLPATFTQDSLNAMITNVMRREINLTTFADEADVISYKLLNNKLSNDPIRTNRLGFNLYLADQQYYKVTKEWEQYANLYIGEREKFIENEEQYNEVAWTFYQNTNNVAHLQKAVTWMEQVVAKKNNVAYYFTLAHLLAKLKQKERAVVIMEKVIRLVKAANEDTSLYEETLAKIKQAK